MQSPYLVQCLQLHEVDPLSIDELPNPIHQPAGVDKLFRWERAWTSQGQSIVEGRSFNCPIREHTFQECFDVSVAMVKTLSCLSGKYKERALEVLSLADLTEQEIHGS
eukprot:5154136-Amphidinium_carterae.1